MARISGVNIPDNKKIEFSLRYIYGVGQTNAKIILHTAQIDIKKMTSDLSSEEINRIQSILEKNYKVEGELRREKSENIKRLKEIGTWRGTRHSRHLPIHGRTKTNSRTLRGNIRKTMGSGRKPAGQKT